MDEAAKAAGAAGAGAAAGYGVVAATGMTAAGMVGGGAGFGAAADPVGAAVGALQDLPPMESIELLKAKYVHRVFLLNLALSRVYWVGQFRIRLK